MGLRDVRSPRRAGKRGVSLLALLALLLAACGGGAESTPNSEVAGGSGSEASEVTGEESGGEEPADYESVTIEYANPVPEGDAQAYANTVAPWIDLIRERTGGAVEVNASHGGSLLTHPDMMEGVGDGLADMGSAQLSIDPSAFPLWSLSGLHDPEIGTGLDAFEQTMVTRLMLAEVPALQEEVEAAGLKLLFSIASSPHHLLTGSEIDGLSGLEGMQIRTYGEFMPRLFQSVGAIPVDMPPDEVYTGLDRGVVDGAYSLPAAFRDLGWAEVAEQVTMVGNGTTPPLNAGFSLVMNADKWEGLSDDMKVVMLEAAREIERQYSEVDVPDLEQKAIADMEEMGLTISELSEDEIAQWSDAFPDLWSQFAEDLEAKGMPGQKLVDTYLELAALNREELESRYNELWDSMIEQYR